MPEPEAKAPATDEAAAAAAAATAAEPKPAETTPAAKTPEPTQPGPGEVTPKAQAPAAEAAKAPQPAAAAALKLPEGSLLSEARLAEIATEAKEKGLKPEEAQALLDREDKAVRGYKQQMEDGVKSQAGAWLEEVKSDKEIGGEGFEENVEYAKRAVDRFSTPQFRQALVATGLGNHPEVVRVFARIGREMADDTFIQGGRPPQKGRSAAELLYGEESKPKE